MSSVSSTQSAQCEVGNTRPPRALIWADGDVETPLERRIRSRSWFFTLNNPELGDVTQLTQYMDTMAAKYCMQMEQGESGTPHLQGVVYFDNAWSFGSVKQIDMRAHWERTKSWIKAVKYCMKSETRIDGPWTKGVLVRNPVKTISVLRGWQQAEYDRLCGEPDDRSVRWLYDTTGNVGKTQFAKYLLVRLRGVCVVSGKGANMLHILAKAVEKEDVKIVVFLFTRSVEDYVSYSTIESVKDGLVVSGKYDSQTIVMNSPHVLVLANFKPDESKLSADRWDIREIV